MPSKLAFLPVASPEACAFSSFLPVVYKLFNRETSQRLTVEIASADLPLHMHTSNFSIMIEYLHLSISDDVTRIGHWSLCKVVIVSCVYICKQVNYRLDNCTTLWGERELVHVQNVEQLHAHVCNQNMTQHCTSSGCGIYHAYSTHEYNTGTVSWAYQRE